MATLPLQSRGQGLSRWVYTALALGLSSYGHAADFERRAQSTSDQWSFQMTTYGWVSWVSGDITIRGREFDVDLSPSELVDALDWSGLPVWMSYAEARKGRFGLFNDIIYSKITGSADFARGREGVLLNAGAAASVEAGSTLLIMELGAAYEVWKADVAKSAPGSATAIDLVGGVRYWRQEANVSADITAWVGGPGGLAISGTRAATKSGDVDWWDPFVGLRLRHAVAEDHNLMFRADIGGFDVGSKMSWHAIATYDVRLLTRSSYAINGYLGYKALAVDYAAGTGTSRYEYDAVQHGPVLGLQLKF